MIDDEEGPSGCELANMHGFPAFEDDEMPDTPLLEDAPFFEDIPSALETDLLDDSGNLFDGIEDDDLMCTTFRSDGR